MHVASSLVSQRAEMGGNGVKGIHITAEAGETVNEPAEVWANCKLGHSFEDMTLGKHPEILDFTLLVLILIYVV